MIRTLVSVVFFWSNWNKKERDYLGRVDIANGNNNHRRQGDQ